MIVNAMDSFPSHHCFGDSYKGKQPVAWEECCAEYLSKELQESMDRCTNHRDITEITLKMALTLYQTTKFWT